MQNNCFDPVVAMSRSRLGKSAIHARDAGGAVRDVAREACAMREGVALSVDVLTFQSCFRGRIDRSTALNCSSIELPALSLRVRGASAAAEEAGELGWLLS